MTALRTLVIGGGRSGKSAYAETLAKASSQPVTYVATARPAPTDDDFLARIAAHKKRRPPSWATIDNQDATTLIDTPPPGVLLIDDLGTWLAELITAEDGWDQPAVNVDHRCAALIAAITAFSTHDPATHQLIIVTPEIGMSIIPEHASMRRYRDLLGTLNQRIAAIVEAVYLVVAGCPVIIKQP